MASPGQGRTVSRLTAEMRTRSEAQRDDSNLPKATRQRLRNGLETQTQVHALFCFTTAPGRQVSVVRLQGPPLGVPDQPPGMQAGKPTSSGSEGVWQDMNFSEACRLSGKLELLHPSLAPFLLDSQLWQLLSG